MQKISRRAFVALLGGGGLATSFGAEAVANVRIDDRVVGDFINPFVYGSNEIGTMDGGAPSVDFDLRAGVTIRRLGGNLMTTYNWRNNAANSGSDYRHFNGNVLLDVLGAPEAERDRPGEVVELFLANSRKLGVSSLLTLPLAGFVAADANGAVAPGEAAPSPRFTTVDWSERSRPGGGVNIPALVARLVAEHGGARAGGVRGYYLDNEPGLWTRTHPRIVRTPPTIGSFIKKSLRAAAAIKKIDPDAWVLGPASWGAPEFLTFQDAPDWADFSAHGSFLAAYLSAFHAESRRRGLRLLDCLDVHFYPQFEKHGLGRTDDPALAAVVLDAPRSLDDAGFCEKSWVAETLGCGTSGAPLPLPLLPSLRRIVEANFPGLGLSFGEYNFGGPGVLASGLAVADALGRFGRSGVTVATYWGALDGFVGEAFGLYRTKIFGRRFGSRGVAVESDAGPGLSLFCARGEDGGIDLVAINKTGRPMAMRVVCASGRSLVLQGALGFDAARPVCGAVDVEGGTADSSLRLVVPEFCARRFVLG